MTGFTPLLLLLSAVLECRGHIFTQYVIETETSSPEPRYGGEGTSWWTYTTTEQLTITTAPSGVSVRSSSTSSAGSSATIIVVTLEVDDFPSDAVPTATEKLDDFTHPPTFAEVATYTAYPYCPTPWTATRTQYLLVNAYAYQAFIQLATSTVRGPVSTTTLIPISPENDDVDGPVTYVFSTATTTINDNPTAATQTPGPMFYLPTGLGLSPLERPDGRHNERDYKFWNLFLLGDWSDSEQRCQDPNNLPPGPNWDWSTTEYKWELAYAHDYAEHRRRKIRKILIATMVILGVGLLGFLESWFWFRRLMTGRWCYRRVTLCWGLLTAFLGLLLSKIEQPWEDAERRKELARKWKQMGAKQRVRLWFKWGFTLKYPVEHLGDIDAERTRLREERNQIRAAVRMQTRTRREPQERPSVDTLPVYDETPAYDKVIAEEGSRREENGAGEGEEPDLQPR
jgi:hypothetical protein